MKVLYAIQGTGNGHLSRARDIVPLLKKYADTDILISGSQADVEVPFKIDYRFKGLGFIFGKSGGVDLISTYKKNNIKKFLKEVKSLDLSEYDLVINDFEPVSAWAAQRQHKACIGLSHQGAVLSPLAPQPTIPDPIGYLVLKTYAPVNEKIGFHFNKFDPNTYTPVIRKEIREAQVTFQAHYTVYLPAYDDNKICKVLSLIPQIKWQVFSKHSKEKKELSNVSISPINNEAFIESLISCTGILCGAGFETPAEALFLKKKLMVIPMKNQYEQQCNAAALKSMGVPVIKSLKKKNLEQILNWVNHPLEIKVDYPDQTEEIILSVLKKIKQ